MRFVPLASALTLLLACSQPSAGPPKRVAVALEEAGRPSSRPKVPVASFKATVDTRTPEQLTLAACTAADGSWRCATSKPTTFRAAGLTPIRPTSWTIPAWFLDAQNVSGVASDANSCTTAQHPCLSYGEIAIHRWGTTSPLLPQATTITLLSDASAADTLVINPLFTPTGSANVVGLPAQVATFQIGTFTPRNRSSATKNIITASGQTGAYWTPFVGMMVNDTTAGAWFWIDQDLGNATASITEPVATSVGLAITAPDYVTIANGDAASILRFPKIPALMSDTHLPIAMTFTHMEVVGTAIADRCTFTEDRFDGFLSEDYGFLIQNSYFTGTSDFRGSSAIVNGAIAGYSTLGFGSSDTILDGDVLIETPVLHVKGSVSFGRVFVAGAFDTDNSHVVLEIGEFDTPGWYYADSVLWGPGSLPLHGGGTLFVNGNATAGATTMLLTGGFTIDGASSAWPWVAGSNAFGAPTTITGARVDSTGGLVNPQTGTRISRRP